MCRRKGMGITLSPYSLLFLLLLLFMSRCYSGRTGTGIMLSLSSASTRITTEELTTSTFQKQVFFAKCEPFASRVCGFDLYVTIMFTLQNVDAFTLTQ